jgi:hypothetical protein
MIDDMLEGIFGEVALGRLSNSKRAQLIARMLFGLLGTGLGMAGAVHIALNPGTGNAAMAASMMAMFLFLACFACFNVAFARTWRWPGRLFILSFVALFATRILFGA